MAQVRDKWRKAGTNWADPFELKIAGEDIKGVEFQDRAILTDASSVRREALDETWLRLIRDGHKSIDALEIVVRDVPGLGRSPLVYTGRRSLRHVREVVRRGESPDWPDWPDIQRPVAYKRRNLQGSALFIASRTANLAGMPETLAQQIEYVATLVDQGIAPESIQDILAVTPNQLAQMRRIGEADISATVRARLDTGALMLSAATWLIRVAPDKQDVILSRVERPTVDAIKRAMNGAGHSTAVVRPGARQLGRFLASPESVKRFNTLPLTRAEVLQLALGKLDTTEDKHRELHEWMQEDDV